MSCRRIRRELLWLVRFGDFDAGSAPHLEHLAGCQGCRDEVGLDRALVRQLRTALAERIGDAAPSPRAWEGVLVRMRQPEPSAVRQWPARLAALLRAGSAMAGASLALVLALNLEMAPIGPGLTPESLDPPAGSASTPVGRGAGLRDWEGRAPAAGTGLVHQASVATFWMPTANEQLPWERGALQDPVAEEIDAERPESSGQGGDPGASVVLSLVPVDAAAVAAADEASASADSDDEPAPPPVPPVGGPS
jgi:hypothetical protein